MTANLGNIPDYIKARSPKRLRALMLETNIKYKAEFSYFDIQQDNKGNWIAWFFRPLDNKDFRVSDADNE